VPLLLKSAKTIVFSHISGNRNDGYGDDCGSAVSGVAEVSFPPSVGVVIYTVDEGGSLVRYIDDNRIIDSYAGGGVGLAGTKLAPSFETSIRKPAFPVVKSVHGTVADHPPLVCTVITFLCPN
jgi:hypothetical protein